VVDDEAAGRARIQAAIDDGSGAAVMERMIAAQAGDASVVAHPDRLPRAAHRVELTSYSAGVVTAIDALEVGLTAVAMGAGRTRADQAVDHAVGIELCCQRGDAVEQGQPLALIHVHRPEDADVPAVRLRGAFHIASSADAAAPFGARSVVIDTLR
jgi:thymidine phosphorylase